MEKTMKRQIGFKADRKTSQVALKSVAPVEKNSKPNGKEVAQKSKGATPKDVVLWIKSHPLFKWSAMCHQIGIDAPNFSRTLEMTDPFISPEMMAKIVPVLSEYGFGK